MRRGGYADVEAEYICGAPEDVSPAPTSEDGYNAVLAYAALYRRELKATLARFMAHRRRLDMTWRKAYNVQFPHKNIQELVLLKCWR